MQPQPNDTTTATALQPGREMDIAISEQVFSIRPINVRIKGSTNTVPMWTENPFFENADGLWDRRYLENYALRSFSTELTVAMLIVEHKRRDGWVFSLQALPPDPANADNMLWKCVFQRSEVDGGFQKGHGATAPEAIARAALAEIER